MGAKHLFPTTDKDFSKAHAFEYDLILSTVADSAVRRSLSFATLANPFPGNCPSPTSSRCSVCTGGSTRAVFRISRCPRSRRRT